MENNMHQMNRKVFLKVVVCLFLGAVGVSIGNWGIALLSLATFGWVFFHHFVIISTNKDDEDE